VARALLIIDFQNDFTSGGALAVPDGDAIAPRVNELIESADFDLIVATRDWHPADHASFREQGGPWRERDALREGFRVAIDREGVRGIDVQPGDSERALDELRAAGVEVS
jgi:hypothetical protein